ncbi:hypothetical protein M1555_01035 [Patescibacteria group bacterium]|nr:hypothetical protein [Patescibacteria group bacterium]
MRKRAIVWVKRYVPSEIFAIIGALGGGILTNALFHNAVATAYGATWGENIFYYGTMLIREVHFQKGRHTIKSPVPYVKAIRNLVVEFGPSEYLDGFIIRPFTMYLFPKLLHNLSLGLVVGKFAADITFYIPTIFSFEMRSKFLRD